MYHPQQRYGFVQGEDTAQVFFHLRHFQPGKWITPPPIVGEPVEVLWCPEIEPGQKAPKATEVHRVAAPVHLVGVVEGFHETRGWGFVRDGQGQSHYLHRSEMTDGRLPLPGMKVMFYRGIRMDRPRACYVTVYEDDQ